jgi:predicted ATPase
MHGHPVHTVIQKLQRHGQATELSLGYLAEEGVADYLVCCFGEARLPAELAHVLHQRTSGNPF